MTRHAMEPGAARLSGRWRILLRELGTSSEGVTVRNRRFARDRAEARDEHAHVSEVFVRVDRDRRRSIDLFCVALLEWRAEEHERVQSARIVVLDSERMRAHTAAVPGGLLVSDLALGRAGATLHSLSLVLLALERRPRALAILDSIEALAHVLDFDIDADGSAAIGETIVRRLDSLRSSPGVSVVVAGTINRSAHAPEDNLRLLAAADLGDVDVRVDDRGRLIDGGGTAWRKHDFALIRFGRPPRPRATSLSLRALRQTHKLAAVLVPPGTASREEAWTIHAARMRQTGRAQQIALRALAGDAATAWELFRRAAGEPAAHVLYDELAARVLTPREFWLLDAALNAGEGDRTDADAESARAASASLVVPFEGILGFPAHSPGSYPQATTPILCGVGEVLANMVQADPEIIDTQIPRMRERIHAAMGVHIPGVRVQQNDGFAPGQFRLQLDEVPAYDGYIATDAVYRMKPFTTRGGDDFGELTNFHPRTGAPGSWLIVAEKGGASADSETVLSPAEHLILHIEVALRSQLARFLGPEEVKVMLDEWRLGEHAALVAETVPDGRSALRLAWLLQALVEESVPVGRAGQVLGAVKGAGGLDQRRSALVRTVRLAMRDRLPGPREARWCVQVPPEIELAMLAGEMPERRPVLEASQWLRRTVEVLGPVISLIATTSESRERIAALARLEHRFIATFSAEELEAG